MFPRILRLALLSFLFRWPLYDFSHSSHLPMVSSTIHSLNQPTPLSSYFLQRNKSIQNLSPLFWDHLSATLARASPSRVWVGLWWHHHRPHKLRVIIASQPWSQEVQDQGRLRLLSDKTCLACRAFCLLHPYLHSSWGDRVGEGRKGKRARCAICSPLPYGLSLVLC